MFSQKIFDIAETNVKPMAQPDRATDDFLWKTVVVIEWRDLGWHRGLDAGSEIVPERVDLGDWWWLRHGFRGD